MHRCFFIVVVLSTLIGCAGPQGIIRLSPEQAPTSSLAVTDSRRDRERDAGAHADCTNLGRGWVGVKDSAFSMPRNEVLRASIASTFPDQFKELNVKRFQTCYSIRSVSGAAGIAGVSYVAAIIADAAFKKSDDIAVSSIEFELDGKAFSATDTKSFIQGVVWFHAYEHAESAIVMGKTVEDAVRVAIEKIKASLR